MIENNVGFLYIRMSDQSRFRQQIEDQLDEIAADPAMAIAEKSQIVYGTSVELVNELLSEWNLAKQSPRLEKVSRAVTTLVINDPTAFSHLFAASHHDFYTATHMVNVATWMVPLAYRMGHRDSHMLNCICQAGMLHDIGKMYLPAEVLNKKGRLSEKEWDLIKHHPIAGHEHLKGYERIDPLVKQVGLEHHERMDGSGYPSGLTGDQIHPVSKICAVVDSFDAMTAFRPFKERTFSVPEAMAILKEETPQKYDPQTVEAWTGLIESTDNPPLLEEPPTPMLGAIPQAEQPACSKRRHKRFAFHSPARVHILEESSDGWTLRPAIQVTAHSISRGGLGFLSQSSVRIDEYVRVFLAAGGWTKRPLEGQVVRCRAYSDGWFEVGVAFVDLTGQCGDNKERAASTRRQETSSVPPPDGRIAAQRGVAHEASGGAKIIHTS
ncbi:MAG: HD domain-containing protein [Phycisphaerae bacterium]|nr:HD domain-containing protein [Phycisphaerae bacterium]